MLGSVSLLFVPDEVLPNDFPSLFVRSFNEQAPFAGDSAQLWRGGRTSREGGPIPTGPALLLGIVSGRPGENPQSIHTTVLHGYQSPGNDAGALLNKQQDALWFLRIRTPSFPPKSH